MHKNYINNIKHNEKKNMTYTYKKKKRKQL